MTELINENARIAEETQKEYNAKEKEQKAVNAKHQMDYYILSLSLIVLVMVTIGVICCASKLKRDLGRLNKVMVEDVLKM